MSEDWFNDEPEEEETEVENTTSSTKYDFDMEPAEDDSKIVITACGRKDDGKTMTAMSFIQKDKRMVAIQFDGKSSRIHKYFYKSTPRIEVFDGNKYYDTDPNYITETAFKSIEYVKYLLRNISERKENKPHYILIDGFDILKTIAEMAMRYNNKKKAFAGFKNRNLWKERNGYIRAIHNHALNASLDGVIYTVYMKEIETKITEGEVEELLEVPKWFDIIEQVTDITLRTRRMDKEGKTKYYVKVMSSKIPQLIRTGKNYDVTDKPLMLGGDGIESQESEPESEPKKSKKEKSKKDKKKEKSKSKSKSEKKEKSKKDKKKEKSKKKNKSKKGITLSDPHEGQPGSEKRQKMIQELAEKQAEMDKEVEEVTEKLNDKAYKTAKTLILESVHDDYEEGQNILIEELKKNVLQTKLISEEAFDMSVSRLIEDGEIEAPRMGYISTDSDDEDDDEWDSEEEEEEIPDDQNDESEEEEEEKEEEEDEWDDDDEEEEEEDEEDDEFDDW